MAKLYSNGEGGNGQGWIRVGAVPSRSCRMNTESYNNPSLSPPLPGMSSTAPSVLLLKYISIMAKIL